MCDIKRCKYLWFYLLNTQGSKFINQHCEQQMRIQSHPKVHSQALDHTLYL